MIIILISLMETQAELNNLPKVTSEKMTEPQTNY